MNSTTAVEVGQDDRVDEIIAEYYFAVEAGNPPSRSEFLARHPEFKVELEAFFDDKAQFERLAAPLTTAASGDTHSFEDDGDAKTVVMDGQTAPVRSGVSGTQAIDSTQVSDTTPGRDGLLQTVDHAESAQSAKDGEDKLVLGRSVRYRMKKELGRGGLGRVLHADDLQLEREVAIKECLPKLKNSRSAVRRFFREARITAQLEHPGIVPVHELGLRHDGSPYYAMKFLRGRPYSSEIHVYHDLPPDSPERELRLKKLLDVFVDVCNAIGYAHSKGILHRDLKPANVMVGDFGEAIVVDWGLAKPVGDWGPGSVFSGESGQSGDASASGTATAATGSAQDHPPPTDQDKTRADAIVGTPAYMSPEQAEGAPLDARSDIFALGVILYEVLTGQRPFEGESVYDIFTKLKNCRYTPPRWVRGDIPKPLEAICVKTLARRPEDRYATAVELGEEVVRWQAGDPVKAYPEPWHDQIRRWARRHRTIVTSVAASILVAFLFAGGWFLLDRARLQRIEREAGAKLAEAQKLTLDQDLAAAKESLSVVLAKLQDESRLETMRSRAATLLEDVQARLDLDEAKKEALAKLEEFHQKKDTALFHATLFTGTEVPANVATARTTLEQALKLVGVDAANVSAPALDERFYDKGQHSEIVSGVYELLLVTAHMHALAAALTPGEARATNLKASLEHLDQAKRLGIVTRAWHLNRRFCLEELGDAAGAKAEEELALKIEPNSAVDYFLLGELNYNAGEYDAAIIWLTKALREKPDHFWAHYFISTAHLRLSKWAEAIAHLTAAENHRPKFVWIYLLRGLAYGNLGDHSTAEAEFQKAIAIDPNEYAIYVNRGRTRMGRPETMDSGVEDLRKAIALKPDTHLAYVNLGVALHKKNDSAGAKENLDRAIALSPTAASAFIERALLEAEQGHLKEALADLDQAKSLAGSPKMRAEVQYERARVLHRMDRIADARSACDLALRLDPEHREAHWLRAQTFLAENKGKLALADLDKYLKPVDSDERIDVDAFQKRAFELERQNEVDKAIADYTKVLERRPDDVLSRVQRGWAYLINSSELAFDDFTAVINNAPNDPNIGEYYTGRGFALVKLGRYQEAIQDADRAVQLAPKVNQLNKLVALYSNAGCIYSQAYGIMRDERSIPNHEELAKQYLKHTVELVAKCTEIAESSKGKLLPADYLRQYVLADPAFRPVLGSQPMIELLAKHGLAKK